MNLLESVVLLANVFINQSHQMNVTNVTQTEWIKNEVVPDVVPFEPTNLLPMSFNDTEVFPGQELDPEMIRSPPELMDWEPMDVDGYYTLIAIDPDVPRRSMPMLREWCHWLVVNIPAGAAANTNIGQTLIDFDSSGPHVRTGKHRYVFLVFKQPNHIEFDDFEYIGRNAHVGRGSFKTEDFMQEHNLKLIAGNFFLSEDNGLKNPRRMWMHKETGNERKDDSSSEESFERRFDQQRKGKHSPGRFHGQSNYDHENSKYFRGKYHKQRNESLAIWKENNIVPDVIAEPPKCIVRVEFEEEDVDLGNELMVDDVQEVPSVGWRAHRHSYHTLIFIDPDAGANSQWLHWLIVNIPTDDISEGDMLARFKGSGPPEGTGLHRYIFLVYKQRSHQEFMDFPVIDSSEPNDLRRANFSTTDFVRQNNLGPLVAGNFYLCQYQGEEN